MAAPAFDFDKTYKNFRSLLALDWQQSPTKGWYRIPRDDISANQARFLKTANTSFGYGVGGYGFSAGTSPTLGNTIIIFGGQKTPGAPYANPAAGSFISVYEQIYAGSPRQHTIETGAKILTSHAFMQKLYYDKGASGYGAWSVGFNTSQFNIFKVPTNDNENLFLEQTWQLVERQKDQSQNRTDINYFNGKIRELKIFNNLDILKPIEKRLGLSLDVCMSPNSKTVKQTQLKQILQNS